MATGIEIARKVLSFYAKGEEGDNTVEVREMRQSDIAVELLWCFPNATIDELYRGFQIACDQAKMWMDDLEKRRAEDADKVSNLIARGAPKSEIAAAMAAALERLHFTPDNVIPTKPRKDAS